jgi:hypothetical protein
MTSLALTPEEHQQGHEWLQARLRSPSRLVTISQLRALPRLETLRDSEILALPDFPAPMRTTSAQAVVWVSEVAEWWRCAPVAPERHTQGSNRMKAAAATPRKMNSTWLAKSGVVNTKTSLGSH